MQRYVDNLREKPKEVRAQVAFVAACALGGVFALVWVSTIGDRLELDSVDPTIVAYEKRLAEEAGVTTEVDTGVGDMLGNLRRGVAGLFFSFGGDEEGNIVAEDENTIDFDALLEEQATQAEIEARETYGEIGRRAKTRAAEQDGQVILIGTSTEDGAENIQ